MADFTALKATIQQYIKQNGNNEITGVLLQNILLSMVSTLGDSAINDMTQALADEVNARGGADTLLSGRIDTLSGRIDTLSGSQTALATFINSGYIFKGVATLSTNPGTINGKVFYLTVTAGQYANMGNVTANAGISVLAYDGSAWSATLLLGMDNTPVENSGNMVKSGGVHFAIAAETARALAAETSSVEFNSTTKNLIFKNSEGTVLYQLAVSTFLNSGAVYAGYATPSTNPPALTGQKVFYVATQAGTYTHFLANYDTPIILANDGIYFLVSGVDDDDWNAEIIMGVDDEPTAGSNNLVKSGGVQNELALGAVYDVSAKNPTAGPNNDGKWESLSALLSDANLNNLIPTSVRKGGMSIKFVQSSDNKYVQYRLMADEFTTDTTQWAIADESVYVENPEFIYVKTDAEGKILLAIKVDGSIYYGAGVPQQVIDYVEELLNEKVDKEEGKSLINAEYASSQSTIENPEWISVTTDSEGRVLEGINSDGEKEINVPLKKLNLTQYGMTTLINELEEQGISGGISQEEADIRYAAKSIEDTVSQNTQDIEAIEASIDVNPPAVVALRNELDGVEARVDAIEQAGGLTPPTLNLYKKISSELIITQAELNSWEDHVVEVIADLKLTGSTNFTLPTNTIIFMNGGQFVSDSYTGTLTLNGAYIKAEPYKIIPSGIILSGYLKADVAYAEWFGAKGDSDNYDAKCFNDTIKYVYCNELHLVANKIYLLEAPIQLDNTTLKGTQTSKLIRNTVWIDVPIADPINAIIEGSTITLNLDTTSASFADLKVGMCVNIVPTDSTNRNENQYEWKNRIILAISNNTVTLSGGNFSKIGAVNYSIINQYPLITMKKTANLICTNIDGGLNYVPYARAEWRQGATVCAGIQDLIESSGDSQTFGYLIENCIIDNSVADAIEMLGVHGTVRHCVIRHCGANAIHLSMCNNIVIENNFMFDTNINPLTGHNDGIVSYSMCISNIIIHNNVMDNCKSGIYGGQNTTCKSTYTNNTIRNFRENGIYFIPYTNYGGVIKDYIISNNRLVGSNDYITTTVPNWEEELEDTPIIPRKTAVGLGIYVNGYYGGNIIPMNISNNILIDCGIYLNRLNKFILTNNTVYIEHSYVSGETAPTFLLKVKNSEGNINGNLLCNTSVSGIPYVVTVEASLLLITCNSYKSISSSFIEEIDSTTEKYANMELVQ